MSKASSFAQGFASTFVPAYTARVAADQKKETDKIKMGAQLFLSEYEDYKAQEAASKSAYARANSLFETEQGIKKEYVPTIAKMFEQGRTVESILKDLRSKGSKWELEGTPEVETSAMESPAVAAPDSVGTSEIETSTLPPPASVEAQTDSILGESTDAMLDQAFEGGEEASKPVDTRQELSVDNTKETPTVENNKQTPKKDNLFNKYRTEISEMVGQDEDFYDKVLAGYTAPQTDDPKYRFTPGADSEDKFSTPKALAVFNLQNSEAYNMADPEKQQEMVIALDKEFGKTGKASDTLTASNYAMLVSKYTKDLSSDDPTLVEEANNWMQNDKPALEAGLTAAASITEKPSEKPIFNAMFTKTDEDGNPYTLQGEGEKVFGEDGEVTGFKLLGSGEVIPAGEVRNIITQDTQKSRASKIQAASAVYKEVGDITVAASVATENFMALDRMALDNPEILTTLVGGGSAIGQSFIVEMTGIVDLLGNLQSQDPDASKESLLNSMNKQVSSLVEGNKISKKTANAYKEFNAAIIRSVFASGRALGQEGNGFSNQDYRVISSSLKNANSYKAFSNNLRKFSTELYSGWNATANKAQNNPLITTAYTIPGAKELIRNSVMGPEAYYTKGAGKDSISVYEWSQGTAGSTEGANIYEEAGQELIDKFDMPEEYKGSKVIMYIGQDDQGNATGKYSFERY